MANVRPFNPLDKKNLGISVADALIVQEPVPLSEVKPFNGAGIYAIYYRGSFPAYAPLVAKNRNRFSHPIYVGKAVPAGARKGGFGLGGDPGQVLYKRVREHSETVQQVRLQDFYCRYLVVDDIWIPLGEAMLIEQFQPIWNTRIDGFGNHDPGKGRYNQQRSCWDTVHPGRPWASKCKPYTRTAKQILEDLRAYFTEHP